MHPLAHGNAALSLAEATVDAGRGTRLHLHRASEEAYHVIEGRGRIFVGEETLDIVPGDTVCIPPGTPHRVENPGPGPLRFLCASSPAYAHDDTVLLDAMADPPPRR